MQHLIEKLQFDLSNYIYVYIIDLIPNKRGKNAETQKQKGI